LIWVFALKYLGFSFIFFGENTFLGLF